MPENISKRRRESHCIRCAKCVSACPMGLEPFLLRNLSVNNLTEDLHKERVLDCVECGCCSFTCPANIPLLDHIRIAKANVNKLLRSKK